MTGSNQQQCWKGCLQFNTSVGSAEHANSRTHSKRQATCPTDCTAHAQATHSLQCATRYAAPAEPAACRWCCCCCLLQLTDPFLSVFRGIIPPLGGIDLSPMLGFFLLNFLRGFLMNFAM